MRNRLLAAVAAVLLLVGVADVPVHAQTTPADSQVWSCSLDNIGATLTRCASNNDPTALLYITDIMATSTTSTAGLFLLQFGTGADCVTGTTSVFPSAAAVPRIPYPANTAAPTVFAFSQPLKVPAGKDLCVIGTVTNTVTIQIGGYKR